jgi:uncharacterized BrkB/YihY/UPF0761 family membrane protein
MPSNSKTGEKAICWLLALANVAGLLYLLRALFYAVTTGRARGKFGAIHQYPEPSFIFNVSAYLVGVGLSFFLMWLLVDWLRRNR